MRTILPVAIVGIVALVGCASAGGPAESSAPPAPESQTPVPTVTETVAPEPSDEPSADPQPTAVLDEPYRLDDDALGPYSLEEVSGDQPLVTWAGPGHDLVHVIGAGSSSAACIPTGESAEIDDGVLEIDFEWEATDEMVACTADIRLFGWAFSVVGGDASITQANVDEWTEGADDITVDIRPASEAH